MYKAIQEVQEILKATGDLAVDLMVYPKYSHDPKLPIVRVSTNSNPSDLVKIFNLEKKLSELKP